MVIKKDLTYNFNTVLVMVSPGSIIPLGVFNAIKYVNCTRVPIQHIKCVVIRMEARD